MTKLKNIYLDNAATTPVDSSVFKKISPYFSEKYGNPSSLHNPGQQTKRAVDKARQQIADFFNSASEEIYFTSSATESDNWAIYGVVDAFWRKENKKPHLIVSAIEHKAILEPAKYCLERGWAEVDFLPVDQQGVVKLAKLKKVIQANTCLVSVMYANSEIGTIQPIQEIGRLIEKINQKRKQKILFHTDAVQAVNYLNCDVKKLKIDLLSLSGHKIYGPKGIGALYIKKGSPINPFLRGGGQEKKMRSSTENIPGIIGLAEALIKVKQHRKNNQKIKKLRNRLSAGILKTIPNVQINGSWKSRLPNNLNLSFRGAEGESVLIELANQGVFVSTGSACGSQSLSSSHVLKAIKLPPELAHCSIRFTLGRQTRQQDIDYVLSILPLIIKRLRKISGV